MKESSQKEWEDLFERGVFNCICLNNANIFFWPYLFHRDTKFNENIIQDLPPN
jgi:hypothetical protein